MIGTEFTRMTGAWDTAVIGTWQLLYQDIANKKSTIRLRAYYYYGGGTQSQGSGQHDVYLDGTNIKSGTFYWYNPGTAFIGEKTIEVNHNSDGTFPGRSVTIETTGWFVPKGSTTGNITGVPNITIPTITTKKSIVSYFKVSGAWKRAMGCIKTNGAWKRASEYLKEGGVWK